MNVQNIPRDDLVVKRAFIPKLDAFVSSDYPNIELKLLAYYLDGIGDPRMAEAFRNGMDLHKVTAAGIYRVAVEDVTDEQRQVGKKLNFSIVYGGGIPTLIRQGVAKDGKEANNLLKAFHGAWPAIGWEGMYKDANPGTLIYYIKKRVEKNGYITTLWGRHLHPKAMHAALNNLCQGCAADLMKWACVEVWKWTEKNDLQSHIVNVVHDDLIMDVTKSELELVTETVPDLMTYAKIADVVPIRPEPVVSFNTWAECKE